MTEITTNRRQFITRVAATLGAAELMRSAVMATRAQDARPQVEIGLAPDAVLPWRWRAQDRAISFPREPAPLTAAASAALAGVLSAQESIRAACASGADRRDERINSELLRAGSLLSAAGFIDRSEAAAYQLPQHRRFVFDRLPKIAARYGLLVEHGGFVANSQGRQIRIEPLVSLFEVRTARDFGEPQIGGVTFRRQVLETTDAPLVFGQSDPRRSAAEAFGGFGVAIFGNVVIFPRALRESHSLLAEERKKLGAWVAANGLQDTAKLIDFIDRAPAEQRGHLIKQASYALLHAKCAGREISVLEREHFTVTVHEDRHLADDQLGGSKAFAPAKIENTAVGFQVAQFVRALQGETSAFISEFCGATPNGLGMETVLRNYAIAGRGASGSPNAHHFACYWIVSTVLDEIAREPGAFGMRDLQSHGVSRRDGHLLQLHGLIDEREHLKKLEPILRKRQAEKANQSLVEIAVPE